jgi:hypothetical protein
MVVVVVAGGDGGAGATASTSGAGLNNFALLAFVATAPLPVSACHA